MNDLPTRGYDTFGKPCRCQCHDTPGIVHFVPCCLGDVNKIGETISEDHYKITQADIDRVREMENDELEVGSVVTLKGQNDVLMTVIGLQNTHIAEVAWFNNNAELFINTLPRKALELY